MVNGALVGSKQTTQTKVVDGLKINTSNPLIIKTGYSRQPIKTLMKNGKSSA